MCNVYRNLRIWAGFCGLILIWWWMTQCILEMAHCDVPTMLARIIYNGTVAIEVSSCSFGLWEVEPSLIYLDNVQEWRWKWPMVQTRRLIAILRGFNEKGGGKQAKRDNLGDWSCRKQECRMGKEDWSGGRINDWKRKRRRDRQKLEINRSGKKFQFIQTEPKYGCFIPNWNVLECKSNVDCFIELKQSRSYDSGTRINMTWMTKNLHTQVYNGSSLYFGDIGSYLHHGCTSQCFRKTHKKTDI